MVADAREQPQRERVVAHDVAHHQGITVIKLPHSDAGRNGSAMPQPADPGRIPSTEDEHAAALGHACDVRAWLAERGWPAPALEDSGNGAFAAPEQPIDRIEWLAS